MTGIGTVLADDPSLTVRASDLHTNGQQPLRVVLDSRLRMPGSAKMLGLPGATLVCCSGNPAVDALSEANAEVKSFGSVDGRIDIAAVLRELAERGINDLLVEAGPRLAGQLLDDGLVDELVIYQAPHIMGSQTLNLVETPTWSTLAKRQMLTITEVRRIGCDTRITAHPRARAR